ncbi:unnamed protein product [Orchesella dallaii]|uniref:Uncharacterized protein n=1 Tax=Orchesella dallaii TaxID=48710 RepID=A0ABP1S7G5_9HEXA
MELKLVFGVAFLVCLVQVHARPAKGTLEDLWAQVEAMKGDADHLREELHELEKHQEEIDREFVTLHEEYLTLLTPEQKSAFETNHPEENARYERLAKKYRH